ncbi:hypothetical protein [Burkholderia pseudomallei]|uniref:hypothetical protein n=1 Tax=Burkholderia pseudomallei TaxID=28450 RepID=UPI0005372BAA|nr:hypothetical protein [Burkholderia pseudomallei]KGW92102.1 hypothetical protein Y048_4561 [Burkholderia pseudomallei MSHR456]
MEIIRPSTSFDGLLPEAYAVIRSVNESAWHHGAQQILPPRVTYSRSLDKVCKAWLEVIPALDSLQAEFRFDQPTESQHLVETKYAALLQALNEHLDACFSVLRCAAPKPASVDGLFSDRVVRAQKLPGFSTFDEQVLKGYRQSRLGAAANILKHAESRLRLLGGRTDTDIVLGYYLDGPLPSGAIGPNTRLHADGNSAFSFNRDMMLHFWWLYRSSQLMANVLRQTLGKSITPAKEDVANIDTSWVELCKYVGSLPPHFFPDESLLPYPLIRFDRSTNKLHLRFPAGRQPSNFRTGLRLTAFITIDDGGQPYKIPYTGNDEMTVEATLNHY